jgi:septum formation protein
MFLNGLNVPFSIVKPDVEEMRKPGERPLEYVQRNAEIKAVNVLEKFQGKSTVERDTLIISADTIVHIGDEVLEKPVDANDQRRMLARLSGNWHTVTTAVHLLHKTNRGTANEMFKVSSQVLFKTLNPDEMDFYVGTKDGLDKAGGYGLQEVGCFLVREIKGSYSNVIGLPVAEMLDAIRSKFGINLLAIGTDK